MSSTAPARASADDSFVSSDEESFELIDGKSPANRSSTPSSDGEESVVHTDGEEDVDYPESPASGDEGTEEVAAAVERAEDVLKGKIENQIFEHTEQLETLLIKNELAEKEMTRLKTEVVEQRVVGDMMEENLTTLRKENRKLLNELDRKGAAIFDMGEELNKTMTAKNTLEMEKRGMALRLDQLERRLVIADEEKKGLEAEVAQQTADLSKAAEIGLQMLEAKNELEKQNEMLQAEMAQQAADFEEHKKSRLEKQYEDVMEERREYSRRYVSLQETIAELTGRLEAAQKEATAANEQKEEMQIRLADVDAEVSTLRGFLETYDAQRDRIARENEYHQVQMQSVHNARLEEAKEAAESATRSLEQLLAEQKEDIEGLLREAEATGQYLEQVLMEKEELAETVRCLEDEVLAMEESKTQLEDAHRAQLEAAEQEAADAKRAIDSLTVEHDTVSKGLIDELEHTGQYLEKVLEEKGQLAETVRCLEEEAKALEESKAQMRTAHCAELEAAQLEAADTKRASDALTVEHNTTIERLLTELEATGKHVDEVLAEKAAAKLQVQATDAQLNMMSEQLAAVEAKLKTVAADRDALAHQLAYLPVQSAQQEGRSQALIQKLKERLEVSQKETANLKMALEHANAKSRTLKDLAIKYKIERDEQLVQSMEQLQPLNSAPEQQQGASNLETKLAEWLESKKNELSEVESLKKQLNDITDAFDVAHATLQDQEKELTGLRTTATNYQAVYDSKLLALRPHCDNLRAKAQQFRVDGNTEAASKLETMIDVLEGRRSVSLDYLGNLEAWILQKADFLNHRGPCEAKKEEVEEDRVQKKIAAAEQRAEHLEQRMGDMHVALYAANDEREKLQQQIDDQKKELSALRVSSASAAADYKAACDERDFFRKSLKTVTEDLDKMEGVEERLRNEMAGFVQRAERLEKELDEQKAKTNEANRAIESNSYEMCRQATKHRKRQQESEDTEMGLKMRIEHLEKEIESLTAKITVGPLQSAPVEEEEQKAEEKPIRTVTLFRGENGQFGMKKKGCVVHKVYKGTSAEVAGVKKGDEIVSIDGVETASLNKDELRQLFEKAEESIELVLVHNPEDIKSNKLTKQQEPLDSLVNAACDTMSSLAIAEPKKQTRTVAFAVGEEGVFGLVHTGTSINSVVEGGAAEAGGVQRGDQIMAIDGVNVELKSEADIEELFAKAREAGSITMELRYNIERLNDLETHWHN